MEVGKIYFLSDDYLKQNNLCFNKGPGHDRPFFCCSQDQLYPDIKWMVPVSTKVTHYEEIYERRMNEIGKCDGLDFVYLHNRKSVARINAAFPVIDKFVKNIYINANTGADVTFKRSDQIKITRKLNKLISLQENGRNIFYNDVQEMRRVLIQELEIDQNGENVGLENSENMFPDMDPGISM